MVRMNKMYELWDSTYSDTSNDQAVYELSIRRDQQLNLVKSVLVGMGGGLVIGLIGALLVTLFSSYEPALRTILLSLLALALYGTYLGFVYGSQSTDKEWMRIAALESGLRAESNRRK